MKQQENRPLTELEQEQEVSLEFETPHTPWAKPWAGGTVRALFFIPWRSHGTEAREAVELAQRFDLEADAACRDCAGGAWLGERGGADYWPPDDYRRRWAALEKTAYDVYIFLGLEPELLPEAMAARVRRAVSAGAGALLAGVTGRGLVTGEESTENEPAPNLPAGTRLRCGRGRIMVLPQRPPVRWRLGWETGYDYLCQERGRALLWAAGRPPRTSLSVTFSEEPPVAAQNPSSARLAWRNAPEGTVFSIRLRRDDGWETVLPALRGAGSAHAALTLPPVRAGDYRLDVIARSPEGVENWSVTPFPVASPVPAVILEIFRDWADPETETGPELAGRAFVGTLSFDEQGSVLPIVTSEENAPANGTVRIEVMDRRGRVLVRRDLPAGETEFRLPVDRRFPMLNWVRALLMRAGSEAAASELLPFRVTRRRREDFNLVMWGVPRGELAPYAVESLAREGVTVILERGLPPPCLAAHEIAFMPYATWLGSDFSTLTASLDRNGILRYTGCCNDRRRFADHVARVAAGQLESRRHGAFAYSLGDENAVRASCLAPECLDAYRTWLSGQYRGDIAALNKSWGSDYASFAEVSLLEPGEIPAPGAPEWFREWYRERVAFLKERYPDRPGSPPMDAAAIGRGDANDEVAALQAGNFARWYDRQAFQAWNLVRAAKRFGEEFRKLDPLALTGFEGTNSFAIPGNPTRIRQGGDIDLMVRDLDWWGPYRGPANEIIRSLSGPGFPRGNWFGYFRGVGRPLSRYWSMLNDHMNMTQWWRWTGVGRYHGLLAPHLAPYRNRRAVLEDTAAIRDGLGALLARSEMIDDRVAVLYSLPSTYIVHFDGNKGFDAAETGHSGWRSFYERTHVAWHGRIRAAGAQFFYVTDRQLRRGEFDPGRVRVLVMPLTLALGEKEAALIRDFVASGGTIVADIRPGLYNGRCGHRETGVLDDVFGIRRRSAGVAAAAPVVIPGLLSWPGGRVEPTVETVAARAGGKAGETPVFTSNRYGAGRAILLNFSIEGAPADRLVAAILREAGIDPGVKVDYRPREEPERTEEAVAGAGIDAQLDPDSAEEHPHLRRWRNGGIELLSVTAGRAADVTVNLPEARHACDLRRGKALGPVRVLTAALEAGRAQFFALLPEEAPRPAIFTGRRVRVAGGTTTVKRGARLEAALAVPGAAGRHALRLRVFDPRGVEAGWFGRVVIAGNDPEPLDLDFAYNDPAGTWLVRATDLYSGQSAELRVNLLKKKRPGRRYRAPKKNGPPVAAGGPFFSGPMKGGGDAGQRPRTSRAIIRPTSRRSSSR